jgi:X-Pro dipeptidyl-peptidase
MRPRARSVLVSFAVVAASLAASAAPLAASAAPPARSAAPGAAPVRAEANAVRAPFVLEHGVTKPVFSYANAIRQSVWVKAPDGDGDGKKDLVTADIIRPRELDGTATVPVIMIPSPYYLCCGRGNESETKTYDKNGNPLKLPLFYDNYFEPRGYAVIEVDMAGTARSTGCADEGAASDIGSIKAVVDWLNGRATAQDIHGNAATAYWANGTVGIIGKSYDGTLAEGVAATGVEGLKTIVPISAISSWYDYDRSQGIPFSYDYPSGLSETVEYARTQHVDCSAVNAEMSRDDGDKSGKYTKFWSARDYRTKPPPSGSEVKASVFLVHGLQDTNVKTVNFGRWLALMQKHHVVTKVWLSRLGHTDPFDYRRAKWVDTLHRWFDNQLMGIDNGILDQPRVDVEISPGQWVTSDTWPVFTDTEAFTFHPDGSLTTGAPDKGTATFVNDPNQSESEAIAKGSNPGRLLYVTGSLKKDLRISGEPNVDLTVTTKASPGQVGIALVDYGTQVRVPDNGEGNRTLSTQSCWGKSVSYDDSCYYDSVEARVSTPLAVLARGWARLPGGGAATTITVHLAYNDVLIPAGHQLGLAIFGASPDWLVTLDTGADQYGVDLATSSLELPVVGTGSFAANAGDLRQVPAFVPAGALPPHGDPAGRLPE